MWTLKLHDEAKGVWLLWCTGSLEEVLREFFRMAEYDMTYDALQIEWTRPELKTD